MRLPAIVSVVLACILVAVSGEPFASTLSQNSSQAYVTLLYGDEFLLGVRVLGQSLKDTGTSRDRVVLAAGDVSEYAILTLQADGWLVRAVEAVDNPATRDDGKFPARFYAVYSKLHVFGLVEYEKVVYLDADTLVVHKIDELFSCPGFCATLRHSERFNSGVMVISPSKDNLNSMMDKIKTTSSYTGGDQGFLNEYFKHFASSPVFDPSEDYTDKHHDMMMLPTRYNADIGLYVSNSNRWQLEGAPRVIHYTLGSFKPWDWWCGWLIEEQARWNKYRMRLGPDQNGRRHGVTGGQSFAQSWMPLIPPVVFVLTLRGILNGWPAYLAPVVKWVPSLSPKSPSPILGITAGFASLAISVWLGMLVIPAYVTPSWGWILAYEYVFMFMFLIYGKFLHYMAVAGKQSGASHPTLNKGLAHQPPWTRTGICAGTLATLFLVAPILNTLLGVPGFVPKILLTVAGGLITVSVATHIFAVLATAWFYQLQPGTASALL